jgi:flagella basal body P-ring formation protein FlgA
MTRASSALLLCLTLCLCAARAHALGLVALIPAVTVKGEIVELGDLFTNLSPDKAQLPAAYAPRPGERAVYDVERLMDIARAQGVAWAPRSRFDRAIVERAGRLIDRETVIAQIRAGLQSAGLAKDDQIILDNEMLRFFVPAESQETTQLRDLRFDAQSRRFTALLMADASAVDALVPVSGHIVRMIDIPVPARQIGRDEVIAKRDIRWVKLPADRVDSLVVTQEEALVGQTPRYMLRAGDPVRAGDVHAPLLVAKGSLVTMVYQTANMVITVRGKAVQDGAKGETIRVMNIQSKRELDAVVSSADTVVIPWAQTASIN